MSIIDVHRIPYDVILSGGSQQYYLRECIESLTLEDSLDQIAYKANIKLVAANTVDGQAIDQWNALPSMLPGTACKIIGYPYASSKYETLLSDGVIWEQCLLNSGRRHINIPVFDKTIYLAKSEDDMLFPQGVTATQRIQTIAAKWNIPVNSLADTGAPLSRGLYRGKNLWQIIQESLQETAEKSGRLFRLSYRDGGMVLRELGAGTVWKLEFGVSLVKIDQNQTLEGSITQVKVVGSAKEDQPRPVLGTFQKDVDKFGTLQKVYSDEKVTSLGAAEKVASAILCGIQETVSCEAVDINTIRAGDLIDVPGWPELYVCSVTHNCGSPGTMSIEAAPKYYVARKYYARESF